MVVGLGTGSTVYFTIERLSERMRSGLRITGIPTSFQTALRAREAHIPLTTLDDNPVIDIAVDGADEVDPKLRLIKGRGAAHLREKCVAAAAKRFIVVVDEQKIGEKTWSCRGAGRSPPLCNNARAGTDSAGSGAIRSSAMRSGRTARSSRTTGILLLTADFTDIKNPEKLEAALAAIPGVIESGLFCGFVKKTTVIIGGQKKVKIISSADIIA